MRTSKFTFKFRIEELHRSVRTVEVKANNEQTAFKKLAQKDCKCLGEDFKAAKYVILDQALLETDWMPTTEYERAWARFEAERDEAEQRLLECCRPADEQPVPTPERPEVVLYEWDGKNPDKNGRKMENSATNLILSDV